LAIEGKGDRAAAGIVSELRGANVGSISQREASRRRVSHEWVAQRRKELRQKTYPSENGGGNGATMPSDNTQGESHSASRMTRMGYSEVSGTMEETENQKIHGQVKENEKTNGKVEVSSGGSK